MNLKTEVQVIECETIELSPRDMIYLRDELDFEYIVSQLQPSFVFKKGKSYFALFEGVAYVYQDKHNGRGSQDNGS